MGGRPPRHLCAKTVVLKRPSERSRPCRKLPRLVWISQSRFFHAHGADAKGEMVFSRRVTQPTLSSAAAHFRSISSMSALDRKLARISSLLKRAWPSAVANNIQIWPMSRSRSVNHGTDTSNFLPPAMRSNSIARSSPPRSSSWPTTPESPRSAASTA